MAQMNPSPSKPVVRYPTALLEDKELITTHDTRLPDYKALEYGTPYPDQNKFPGLKLIYQEPLGEDDRMVRRIWAGDRQDQDLHNADRKYSGGSTDHPILVRRYLFPEDGYEPLPTGTPDSQFPEAVLVEEEVAQPENRNGYLAVTRVFETLPGPALSGVLVTDKGQLATITTQVVAPGTTVTPTALTVSASVKPDSKGKSVLEKVEVPEVFSEARFSAEKPEVVPTQFRAAVPEETTESVQIGDAEMPELDEGDKAASEEQLTKFTKRVRRVRRDLSNVSESLEETNVDEAGIVETITKTLKTGPQTVDPSATVRGQVEELGDGLTLKTEVEKAKIFGGKVLAAERPDPVPEKFRVAVPTKTIEETVPGTAADPVLAGGEIAESEQQVTEFTKRTRKTLRDIPKDENGNPIPVSLTQTETTNEGLKATVTETFQTGDTTDAPTATKSIESQAIGDGTYVVRTTVLPEVFSAKSLSVENPDPVPQKFRIAVPATTTEETVEGSVATTLSLDPGELSKAEQQATKFTKRTRKTSRLTTALPKTLTQTATTNDGLKATVTETLQTGDTTETPTATKSIESEAMGDGTYVVRKTELPEVFDAKAFTTERPDPVPEKFRVAVPTETVEETVAGTAAKPTLVAGDLSASQQQATKFTKRTRKIARTIPKDNQGNPIPVDLTQKATTQDGLLATVTESFQTGDTALTPTAKVSVESQALGDGTYVVRKTELPEVFSAKRIAAEKPTTIPERFRASVPDVAVSETSEGTITQPTVQNPFALTGTQVSKSETQVSKHTKRVEVVTRDVASYPQLSGQDLDKTLNAPLPYVEYIATSIPQGGFGINNEATPLENGKWLVRTTDTAAIKAYLATLKFSVETEVNIRLPDVLETIQVNWEKSKSEGGGEGEVITTGGGGGWAGVWLRNVKTDTANVSATIRPTFAFSVRRGYNGPAVGKQHFLFTDNPDGVDLTLYGSPWPIFREVGATVVFTGKSVSKRKTEKWVQEQYTASGGNPTTTEIVYPLEDSASEDTSFHIAEIPACLHGAHTFTAENHTATVEKGRVELTVTAQGSVSGSISATNPTSITAGTYVVSRSHTPYAYGLWKVSIVTVDITPYL